MLLPLSDIVFSGTFALPARRGESRSWSVSCHRLPERASAPPAPPPRELPSIPSFPSRGSPKPSDPQPLPWGGEQSALGAAGLPRDHGTQHPWVALGGRAAPPGHTKTWRDKPQRWGAKKPDPKPTHFTSASLVLYFLLLGARLCHPQRQGPCEKVPIYSGEKRTPAGTSLTRVTNTPD